MLNSAVTNLINIAYEFSYNYDLGSSSGGGILSGMLLIPSIVGIVMLISQWKIFTKAGKPGWACLIPIYNTIVIIQIADLSLIYLLFLCIPFVNIWAIFKIYIEIAHKFGKSTGFGVGLVFLSVIFMPMLAFGDATYEGSSDPYMNSNNYNNNNFNNNNYNNNYNNNNYNSNNNFNNQMNNNGQAMGFDPQTGQPITGYDPQTGQPIYGNQNQMQQTNTFVNNNMNQPVNNTFVDNNMNQPTNNTFVDNNMNQPMNNTFVDNNTMNNQVTEPVQNTFVAPAEPTNTMQSMNNTATPGIDRPDATPVNDINNQ